MEEQVDVLHLHTHMGRAGGRALGPGRHPPKTAAAAGCRCHQPQPAAAAIALALQRTAPRQLSASSAQPHRLAQLHHHVLQLGGAATGEALVGVGEDAAVHLRDRQAGRQGLVSHEYTTRCGS